MKAETLRGIKVKQIRMAGRSLVPFTDFKAGSDGRALDMGSIKVQDGIEGA